MRSKQLLKLLIIGLTLLDISNCKRALAQEDFPEKKVKEMLKEFYTAYITTFDKYLPLNTQTFKIDSIKKKYCTSELLKYIIDQGRLDYDPYLNSQMIDLKKLETLTIRKDQKETDIFYVSYVYGNKKTTIKLRLVKSGGSFKIDHIFLDE